MGMIMIDVDMPEKCGLCPCFHYEYPIYCQAVKVDRNNKKIVAPYGSSRPEWCPLEELEEIRHGEWKWSHGGECSECGYHNNNFDYKYCPMCGAKMEGR